MSLVHPNGRTALFAHVVIAKPLHTFARHALAAQRVEKRK
jgi:hypothetical protein